MKRVFVIHGWDGYPEEGWFPWLKHELEAKSFIVEVPHLPKPGEPRINAWVSKIIEVVRDPDEETYFVGHSIGCQAIARYLETLPENSVVGGAVFVAGFFKELTNLEDDEVVRNIAKEWLTAPLDLNRAGARLKKSVAVFSDDDPYVPLSNKEDFEHKLGSKVIIEHRQGHFSGSTGTVELPIVRDLIIGMTK
jgi:predicted alpha/beta hydrolase family esterase